MIITSYITSAGAPALGLTPTIRIWMILEGSSTLYVGQPSGTYSNVDMSMVEVGDGFYKFDFNNALGYNADDSYLVRVDGGNTLTPADRYHVINISPPDSLTNETISNNVWDELAIDHTAVGSTGLLLNQIKADTNSIMISETALYGLLTTLLKYSVNRTKIDVNNAQMIIYDDDGVTPLTVFDLKDFSGMPSVLEVCERIPTI